MAQGADFRSRITVDGADRVVSDLRNIGAEGEKAFSAVGKAADQSSTHVMRFGSATDGLARQMASLRTAATGVAGQFQTIGKHASDFGSQLSNVANNIIPRWKEILALGTAGGVAGFFKLFESTAKWGKELQENAKQLGLTAGEFALIAKAAKQAGVDVDQLTTGMTKFSIAMQKAGDERKKLFGDLAKDVLGANTAVNQGGVKILRGSTAGGASSAQVVNIPKMEQFRDVAEQAYAVLRKMGAIPKETTLNQWLFEVEKKLRAGGETAEKITRELNQAGANLPVTKLGEQVDQAMPGFRDLFAQFKIPIFDKATGDMRKFTDVFGDFLDQFAKKSPGEQARIVTDTMGRGFLDLIPIMQKGRSGLLQFFDAAKAAGADTSAFDKEIAALDEAQKSINRLDSSISAVRKSFVVPFADVFTPIINRLGESLTAQQPVVKAWATGIAAQAEVIATDLANVWAGAEPKTDFGQGVVTALNAISVAVGVVSVAFQGLTAVFEPFTQLLNSVFGVDYSAKTYALAAAFLYFSGILPALATGLRLVGAALAFMTANPIGLALTAIALIALTIYQNWDKIGPLFQSLWNTMKDWGAWIENQWAKFWTDPIQGIKDQWSGLINWFGTQLDNLWQKLKSLNPLSSSPAATAAIPPARMASGGQVPGSGSGDIVPALLTPGEFVMRRSVVDSLGAGFFAALNGGMGSLVPRSRFATGGIVAETAGGTPVHLHLGNQSFALSGASNVVSALVLEAHRQHVRSAGVKPSWYGGR